MYVCTKDWYVEIQYCTQKVKYIHSGAERCQKYASHPKKLQIKVVRNWILYKKVRERCVYLPPPLIGARGLERLIWLKYNIVLKRENTFTSGLNTLPKIRIASKKASNKSCSELNFVQKSPQAHLAIFLQSGARGLERLIWLKYNTLMKRQNTFDLVLNAAKSTHHIQKSFK